MAHALQGREAGEDSLAAVVCRAGGSVRRGSSRGRHGSGVRQRGWTAGQSSGHPPSCGPRRRGDGPAFTFTTPSSLPSAYRFTVKRFHVPAAQFPTCSAFQHHYEVHRCHREARRGLQLCPLSMRREAGSGVSPGLTVSFSVAERSRCVHTRKCLQIPVFTEHSKCRHLNLRFNHPNGKLSFGNSEETFLFSCVDS